MWLVNTETLKLHQVTDEKQHPFAILSHTWQGQEVTFQDMQNFDADALSHRSGFYKIHSMCRIARRYWKYAWIDTCCIDKTSSAELSEAINSMFRYYRAAGVCYVFLSDFPELPIRMLEHERLAQVARYLKDCKWFTRGWTLQELIAPSRLEFFDSHWNFLGEKADLQSALSEITNIDESVLKDSSRLYTIPVARRMSWASGRQTAREEDIAYCLLGIFHITMPLLYGEGSKAFLRLQQQIAMENSDLSIFAWESSVKPREVIGENGVSKREEGNQYSGIFAETPGDFSKCATLRMHRAKLTSMPGEMTMTNIGLRLSGAHITTHLDHIVLGLNCLRHSPEDGAVEWMGIYLVRFGPTYIRTRPFKVHTSTSKHFWGKVPRREDQPIYLQPRLLPDEVKRTNALLENIVILRYDENTKYLISARHGIPAASYTETGPEAKSLQQQTSSIRLRNILETEERVNPFGGAIFRTKVAEEFEGIHLISVKTGTDDDSACKFAVVVSLQWDGAELRLSYALYESTSDLMQYVDREPAPTEAAGYLERVQDYFLENRAISDLTGLLGQENMPTRVSIPGEAGQGTETRQSVMSIERDTSLLPRTDGYFYLLLKTEIG